MRVSSSNEILGAIKMYMYMNDITQDELAHKLGKSKQSISSIFKSRNLSASNLFEIVNALNIPIYCNIEKTDLK